MNNVLIDDRRIKVDFSQSVSKLWNKFLLQDKKTTKSQNEKNINKSSSSAPSLSKANHRSNNDRHSGNYVDDKQDSNKKYSRDRNRRSRSRENCRDYRDKRSYSRDRHIRRSNSRDRHRYKDRDRHSDKDDRHRYRDNRDSYRDKY
jgi:peptidyl-prolyl cis-trans isomerase-like 4